jgi:hypothetical protein
LLLIAHYDIIEDDIIEDDITEGILYKEKLLEVLNCFPKVKNVVIKAEKYKETEKAKVQLNSNVLGGLQTLNISFVGSVRRKV